MQRPAISGAAARSGPLGAECPSGGAEFPPHASAVVAFCASAWWRIAERVVRVVIISGSICELDDRGALAGGGFLEGGGEFLGARDPRGERAIGAGQGDEIGVGERRADDPAGEPALLVHANRAVHRVVEERMIGPMPAASEVANSCPVIIKPPSPQNPTTSRPGWTSLAATAAGTP